MKTSVRTSDDRSETGIHLLSNDSSTATPLGSVRLDSARLGSARHDAGVSCAD
jgi:hypothetical protein